MRAVVLGGGGVTGIAWQLGVLAGLARSGVSLRDADLVVGTSAGAFVGALLATGTHLDEEAELAADADREELAPRVDLSLLAQAFSLLADPSLTQEQARARIGEMALAAPVGDERALIEPFATRLPAGGWPVRPRLVVTAVNARSGVPVAWDASANVPLVRAVAASCAVPGVFAPVEVDGDRYMDGGVRSVTNADLAAGADRVVLIAPSAGQFRASPEAELARLGAERALLVAPDAAALAAIGPNVLDTTRRGPSLRAGVAQGRALAGAVRSVWA